MLKNLTMCLSDMRLLAKLSNCEDRPSIAIIGGVGAVGAYFSAKLVKSSNLSILGRKHSAHLSQIQKDGLTVITSSGKTTTLAAYFSYVGESYTDISRLQDIVFLSLKQPDITAGVAAQILRISAPDALIVFVGNGIPPFFMQGLEQPKTHIEAVDPGGKIAQLFSSCSVVLLCPTIAANIQSCGVVKVSRPEEKIKVSLATTSMVRPKNLERLLRLLNAAGIATEISDGQAHRMVLEKLQFALSVNMMSGVLNKPLGDIFYAPEFQPLLRYIVAVIGAVGDALKIKGVRSYEQFAKTEVTRTHFSSFYKDLVAGKTTEANAFLGATLELADFTRSQELGTLPDLSPLLKLKALVDKRIDGGVISDEELQVLLRSAARTIMPMAKL
jgi:2-dehydropantoate 2-reductase